MGIQTRAIPYKELIFMTEPRFGPEPNPLNPNLEVLVKVRDFLDRTSRFKFRFYPKCPEPEPDRTVDSLLRSATRLWRFGN